MKKNKTAVVSALAFALSFGTSITNQVFAADTNVETNNDNISKRTKEDWLGLNEPQQREAPAEVVDELYEKYAQRAVRVAYKPINQPANKRISDNNKTAQNEEGFNINNDQALQSGFSIGIRGGQSGEMWRITDGDGSLLYEGTVINALPNTIRDGSKPFTADTTPQTSPQLYNEFLIKDPTLDIGTVETIQEGQNGLMRVTYGVYNNRSEVVNEQPPNLNYEVGQTRDSFTIRDGVIEPKTIIEPGGCKPTNLDPNKLTYPYYYFENCEYDVGRNNPATKLTHKIVAFGTKIAETTQEEVTKPFDEKVTVDPTLKEGERVVDVEGKDGKKITTWSIDTDGEIRLVKEEETEMVTQLVRVGVKVEEIPYKTIIEYDDDKEIGYRETTTPGKNGRKEDGKIVTPPTDEVITIGTKPIIEEKTTPIPYKTTIVEDENLEEGQRVVDQEGKDGLKTVTTTKTYNKETGEIEEDTKEETKDPVDEIIRVGTKKPVIETEKIPYKTIIEYDDDKEIGYRNETPGTEGVKEKESGKIITPPTDKVITIGTKPIVEKTITPIPYKTTTIEDENLDEGQRVVDQEGIDGLKTVTTTKTYNKETGEIEEDTKEETKDPVDEIIRIGTKKPVVETEKIPYDTIYKEDPDKDIDSPDVIEEEGEEGEITNGEITKEKKDRVIVIGTKPIEKEIPFKVKRIFVEDMLESEGDKVIREGENGLEKTTLEITDPTKRPEPKTTIVKEPIDKIIHYGNKKQKEEIIPRQIEKRFNKDLKPNETKVIQEGNDGSNLITYFEEDGKEIITKKEKIKDPVKKIIEYGPSEINKREEPIPYKTIVEYDDSLDEGEEIIKQKGKKGLIEIEYTVVDDEEIILSKKITNEIDEIKVIGTKKVTEKEEEIPFKVIRRENKDLYKGYEKVVQKGKKGLVKKTITNDKVTKEEVLKEKVDEIIEYGTKPIPENDRIEKREIDFKVIYQEDDKLKKGEQKVIQEGKKGIEVTTYKYIIDDNGKLKEVVDKVETKQEVVDKIILIGKGEKEKAVTQQVIPQQNHQENKPQQTNTKTQEDNVKTGVTGIGSVALTLASAATLFYKNKKRD